MNRNLKLYLIKCGFLILPIVILVLLLLPCFSVTLKSNSAELDLGFVQLPTTDYSQSFSFSGIDMIGGLVVKSEYNGNATAKQNLAKLKELASVQVDGSENITALSCFTLIAVIFLVILIILIDFGFSSFARDKGGRFLGGLQIAELCVATVLAIFTTLMAVFGAKLANFSAQNNLFIVQISSAALPCAIAICATAWTYLLTRSTLILTKIFYSQKLICHNAL